MGKNTSISLGDHYEQFLRSKVASGEFASASEVIRDALRQAEERDRKKAALDRTLEEGLASPVVNDFSFDTFLQDMRANYKAG